MFRLYRLIKTITTLPLVALGLPPHACRFTPSCSRYCEQAIGLHGWLRGGYLCLRRLVRCHPGTPAGHDPLPA